MTAFTETYRTESAFDLPEYRAVGTVYTHVPTGLEVFNIANDDKDNLFAFIFPTVPENSRGTPHILEHSVLSGSEQFPVKDPFVQLMKGSMNTFLNAMTFPDKTLYPASSIVEQDFFNLLEVYADAVFFPLLKREVFHQEGFRFLPPPDGGLPSVTGVVFNEMQGNYSDTESIAGEYSYRTLFPGSAYRFDSGGEPWEIPLLTYAEFKDFHRRNYHPSQCRLFLYGSIPAEKTLEFLHRRFFHSFGQPSAGSSPRAEQLGAAERWKEPRYFHYTAPADENSEKGAGTTLLMSWLGGDVSDPEQLLVAEITAEILLGNPGSPLYKALLESDLGEDVSPVSGIDAHLRELVFTAGLRGTKPERREEFEKTVLNTLHGLAEKGIPERTAEGALRRVEFRNREIPGGAPFGLKLLSRSMRGWLHGQSPETSLKFQEWMDRVRRQYARDPKLFGKWVRSELLENSHRADVIIEPDRSHEELMKKKLEDSVSGRWSSMTPEERQKTLEENNHLKTFQETPDAQEALDSIPSLTRRDVPRKIETIPTEYQTAENGSGIYRHRLYTNGIAYLDTAFDTSVLTEEELPYIPLFSKCVDSLGLPDLSYDELSTELSLITGGFSRFFETSAHTGDIQEHLFFRLKALPRDFERAVDLTGRMLTEADFTNTARLKNILFEMRNDFRASIIPRGNGYASLRAAARLSAATAVEERWKGLSQYLFLTDLAEQEKLGELGDILETIRKKLIRRENISCNVTAEQDFSDSAESGANRLIRALPASDGPAGEYGRGNRRTLLGGVQDNLESVILPVQVGFAAAALPAAPYRDKEHARETLLAHILKTGFLWEKIRMEGGAYGASSSANGNEQVFAFSSYRDPQPAVSLEVFHRALETAGAGVDRQSLDKALIALVGNEMKPLAPGAKGFIGFRRALYGITDKERQAKRDAMTAAVPDDIAAAADRIASGYSGARRTLILSEQAAKTMKKRGTESRLPM